MGSKTRRYRQRRRTRCENSVINFLSIKFIYNRQENEFRWSIHGNSFKSYRYSLLGDKAERFSVDPESGQVLTLVPLDREETRVYHLTLVAQDSSPTEPRASAVNLTINVQDTNDNAPRFSSPRYTAYVPDSTKPGKPLFERLILALRFHFFSFSPYNNLACIVKVIPALILNWFNL